MITTVDGRNPANQLRLVVLSLSITYGVLIFHRYIPGGAGFLPSTVRIVFCICVIPSTIPKNFTVHPPSKGGIVYFHEGVPSTQALEE